MLVLEAKVIDAEDRATKARSDMAITVRAERAVTSTQLKIMNKKHQNKHNQLVGEAESASDAQRKEVDVLNRVLLEVTSSMKSD